MRQQLPKTLAYVGYGSGTHGANPLSGLGIVQNVGKKGLEPTGAIYRKLTLYCDVVRSVPITITFCVNGAPTALSATLQPSDVQVADEDHEVEVAAGDVVTYAVDDDTITYPGVPVGVCIEREADEQGYSVGGITGNPDVGKGWQAGAFGNGNWNTYVEGVDSITYSIAAIEGAVTTLAIRAVSGSAPGAGIWRAHIRKNGVIQDGTGGTVDTTVELTGSNLLAIGTWAVADALTFAPPAHVDVIVRRYGTNAPFKVEHISAGIGVTPTTPGQYMLCGGLNQDVTSTNGASTYKWNGSRAGIFAGSDAITMHQAPVGRTGFTAFAMYIERSVAPNTSDGLVTHILQDTGVDTALVVALSEGETDDNVVASHVFEADNLIVIKITNGPGMSPQSYLHWGVGVSEPAPEEPPDEEPPPPLPGSIVVEKQAPEDADAEFTIQTTNLGGDPITLKDGESHTFADLDAGSGYGLAELLPEGWSLKDAVVSNGSPLDNITVAEGEVVTVTLINEKTCECCVATKLAIINQALLKIGISQLLESLDDQTQEAITANEVYEPALREVLRVHPWAFATKYADSDDETDGYLNLVDGSVDEPAVRRSVDNAAEWIYAYRYPVDCVFARRLVPSTGRRYTDTPIPFRVGRDADGLLVFTNEADAVLEYTAFIECQDDFFDALFEDALTWKVAEKLAPSLSRNGLTWKDCLAAHDRAIGIARARTENEQQRDKGGDPDWIAGR